jgi:hypothetical protein
MKRANQRNRAFSNEYIQILKKHMNKWPKQCMHMWINEQKKEKKEKNL